MADNINLTDPQTIIDDTNLVLQAFNDAKNKLNFAAIKYTDNYDRFNEDQLKDGTLLRERMKLAVIRSTTHDVQ